MITTSRALPIATGAGSTALVLASAPWWLAGIAFACFALSLAVVAIQSVFPQESAHRLAWWRDRRLHQRKGRDQRPQ